MVTEIREEERTNRNRHKFRQFANLVAGGVFDIPEENRVLFVYDVTKHREELVGEISFQIGSPLCQDRGNTFDSEYFHVVTFLFVHRDFQGQGIGTKLVTRAMDIMLSIVRRPVRVESAERAVNFFLKLGFVQVKDSVDCLCAGAKLFKTIVGMEKS